MSIRIIYGRSGSGKTSYIIDEIKNKYKKIDDNSLILIVPEQLTFQTEKKLVDEIGFLGRRIEVLSFKRMAYKVFKEVGGLTRRHMESSGKTMLLYKIIETLKEDLKVYSTAARQSGFVSTLSEMICEFKRYNIKAEDLNKIKEDIDGNSFLYNKISDIYLIYEKFESILHKEYIDPDEDLTILKDKIKYSNLLKNTDIWIDEFSGFTPQQYCILEELIKNNCNLNITLNMSYEDSNSLVNREVFSPIIYTRDKIINIGKELGVIIEEPVVLNSNPPIKFQKSNDLAYLEKKYFSFPFKPYKKEVKNIKLFRAINIYSEVEDLANNILKLCRDNNVKFNEIAVITRELDTYENLIKAIFNEYKIPYFMDEKKDITSNKLIVFITSLLDILGSNWRYESVFKYLKTELLDIKIEDIDLLENYVLSSGIKGKKSWADDDIWFKNMMLNYNLKNKVNKSINEDEIVNLLKLMDKEEWVIVFGENLDNLFIEIDRINNARKKFITPLIGLSKKLRGRKTGSELCIELFNFMEEVNVRIKIEQWINNFKQRDNIELVNEYSKIWNLVMELLDQVVEVLGEEEISLKDFSKILYLGFEEHKMGFIPQALHQVIISSVERLRGHNIKYLFLIGVNDGVFPQINNREGILTDNDRIFLKDKGVELAKDTRTAVFEEQYLIYTTLTLGEKYLSVSYPMADHEGKALRPSIIISRLKALFPNLEEESNVVNENEQGLINSKVPTFNKFITQLNMACEKEELSSLWGSVFNWFYNEPYWQEKIKKILEAFSYSNQVEVIGQEKALKLYGENKVFSVSRIESYTRCPFAYFIKYGLKAKERKIFELTPPDLGTLMHKILDNFSKDVDKNLSWSELDEKKCKEIIEIESKKEIEEFSGNIFKKSSRYEYFGERIKRILIRSAKLIMKHMQRGSFKPLGYEIAFGLGKEGYSPIELQLSTGEKVQLVGKIDRVDKLLFDDEEYFRIIDYKSGNKDFKLWEVYYGLQVQLLTYLDAILEKESEIEEFPVFPAGILYFKIDNPIIKGSSNLSDKEIEEEIMKELKMKGLVLADTKIVKEMDTEIKGASLILPVGLKKDGDFTKTSHVATQEQFKLLREHVKNKLSENCRKMLEGYINIKPCKTGESTACDYCKYESICSFDLSIQGNEYCCFSEKKDSEVWELLKNEKEENSNGRN